MGNNITCPKLSNDYMLTYLNGKIAYKKDTEGNQYWYDQNEKLHRDNAPALLLANGYYEYRQHGLLHRDQDDGPAVKHPNGYGYAYCKNDLYHRTNGPAVEFSDGRGTRWYVNGIEVMENDISTPVVDNRSKCYNCENKINQIKNDCIIFCSKNCLESYCNTKNK